MNILKKTILLVEDQILSAAPAIKFLKKAGYDIIYVLSGEKAVSVIEAGIHVDLIVMDIDLGLGICGITASIKINLINKIPILFFTNHSEQYIKEKLGNSISMNYLTKKNPYTSLIKSIENILF